jgi:hypothetical protein
MSDYSVTTDFSVKDGLTAGDPEKLILGSDFDVEFDAIAVAIATKYDSADLASQAQAEAETSNVVLMTPLRVANWADANAGIVGDLQALASPGADRILFWDDGAAGAAVLTPGNGIEISTTNLQLEATIAGNGLTYSAGVVNVVGGNGITANANDIALTDAAASTTNPVDISTGTVSLDVEALTTIEGSALAATDTFYVEDAGVSKGIEVQAMGMRAQLAQTRHELYHGVHGHGYADAPAQRYGRPSSRCADRPECEARNAGTHGDCGYLSDARLSQPSGRCYCRV